MAHFPQSQGNVRAPRVQANHQIMIRTEHGHASGVLQRISSTGGVARLKQQVSAPNFGELVIRLRVGEITALIELLASARNPEEQAFRFVAIDDDDHARLQLLMRPDSALPN